MRYMASDWPANIFFSQPLSELKLHQVALLVGMVKGPSYYNPRRQPERALARRNLVIDLLAEQGAVDEEQATQAKQRPLGITKRGSLANSTYPGLWTWSNDSCVKITEIKI